MLDILNFFVLHQCRIDTFKRPNVFSFVSVSRLVWVGPLTVFSSIAGVLFVRFLAVTLLQPAPTFAPLNVVLTTFDTALFVSLAVAVFRRVGLLALDPIGTYKIIAFKALLLSFLPDIALALSHLPGVTWPNALALMVEHVMAWAVCVLMLTKLTTTNGDISERS